MNVYNSQIILFISKRNNPRNYMEIISLMWFFIYFIFFFWEKVFDSKSLDYMKLYFYPNKFGHKQRWNHCSPPELSPPSRWPWLQKLAHLIYPHQIHNLSEETEKNVNWNDFQNPYNRKINKKNKNKALSFINERYKTNRNLHRRCVSHSIWNSVLLWHSTCGPEEQRGFCFH